MGEFCFRQLGTLYKGALVNAKAEYEMIPLHMATNNSNKEMISLLLENGADIEAKDHDGFTAIFHAIDSESLEMVKLLIERGADFEAQNTSLSTPLICCTPHSGK